MKVFLDTVGCRLNQAEIEQMARRLRAAGHEITGNAAEAELAIINTCTVTNAAASDSRAAVRRAARAGVKAIVVTGCWATLEPESAAGLPAVKQVIPNSQKDALLMQVLGLPVEPFDLEPVAREPLPGLRARTRAFIKVQDGCNNTCTYCVTRLARGAARSRSIAEVLAEVRAALQGGTKEIVLTGVHLGAWGQDLPPAPDRSPLRLSHLITALLGELPIPRLRLSSLEPWDITPDFFSLWADARLCRHLHLPLQSGSASVLQRMARKTRPEAFAALLETARRLIPAIAITTDVIVGFPGESEAEFAETVEFVKRMGFAGGHVFAYSPRPGTPAARLEPQIRPEIKKERSAILRQIFAESALAFRRQFLGQRVSVLWESAIPAAGSAWTLEGLTDNYLRVTVSAPQPRWNQIDEVEIIGETPGGLLGRQIEGQSQAQT